MKRMLCSCCLLLMLLVGCQSTDEVSRRVVVICSGNSQQVRMDVSDLVSRFEALGIRADVKMLYLDNAKHLEHESSIQMSHLLDSIAPFNPHLIMVKKDAALSALLTCSNPKAHQYPILYADVNYPPWELLKQYNNVRGFWEKMNYVTNLDLIAGLIGGGRVHFYYEPNVLGRRNYNAEVETLAKVNYPMDTTFIHNRDSLLFMPIASVNKACMLPFTALRGDTILRYYRYLSHHTHALLLDVVPPDRSRMALSYCGPVFSTVGEAFNLNDNVVGGYFTSRRLMLDDWIGLAADMLLGHPLPQNYTIEHHQEFVFRYKMLKRWGIDESLLPKDSVIVDEPFYLKYDIYLLFAFLTLLCLLAVILRTIRSYRKSSTRTLYFLTEVHKHQTELLHNFGSQGSQLFTLVKGRMFLDQQFMDKIKWPESSLPTQEFLRYIHPDDMQQMKLSRVLTVHGQNITCDFRAKFFTDDFEHYQIRCGAIKDSSKTQIMAGILLNVQDEYKRRDELKRTTQLAKISLEKTSFFESITHEIRTPLNAIMGFTDLMVSEEAKFLSKEDKKIFVDEINDNNDKLQSIINSILELSRLESGKAQFQFVVTPVNEIVQEAYDMLRAKVNPSLVFKLDLFEVPMNVKIDRQRFLSVMEKLVHNADKFTQEGCITLRTCYDRIEHHVCVVVEDTGCGIERDKQKFIMHSFFKVDTLTPGTGLGLTICEVIIKKFGGHIDVVSEYGKGSKFIVSLPSVN